MLLATKRQRAHRESVLRLWITVLRLKVGNAYAALSCVQNSTKSPQIERQKGVFSLNLFALISVISVCVCFRVCVCVGYCFSAAIAIRMLFWL